MDSGDVRWCPSVRRQRMLHEPDPLQPSTQLWPQVPQLLPSVLVLTQLEPHQVRPAGQQWLLEQTLVPPQFMPQVPQFAASLVRLWQPSPQQVPPVPQATPHDWQ